MPHPSWNESYASGNPPWDTGKPEPLLVEFVTSRGIAPARTLEIGAGTGTNAIWLAERGFDVLGVDVSSLAVEIARAKIKKRDLRCRSETLDCLGVSVPDGSFQFVFDRGCLHVFDEPAERERLTRFRRQSEGCGSGQQWRKRPTLIFFLHPKSNQTRKNRLLLRGRVGVWNCESSDCIRGCDGARIHAASSLARAGG
jgi:SAM-dependent methyltransferase